MNYIYLRHIKSLDTPTIRFLYDLIKSFPGMYFREIQNKSQISVGSLDYNIRKLMKIDFIAEEKVWRNNRYFSIEVPKKDRFVVGILRNSTVRSIIKSIDSTGEINSKDLSAQLKLSRPTVIWYLEKLKSDNILECKTVGNKKFYVVKDGSNVIEVMNAYRESFSDKIINNFISMWNV